MRFHKPFHIGETRLRVVDGAPVAFTLLWRSPRGTSEAPAPPVASPELVVDASYLVNVSW